MAKSSPPRYRVIAISAHLGGSFDNLDDAEACFNEIDVKESCMRNGVLIKDGHIAVLIDTKEAVQLKANHYKVKNT